MGLSDEFVYLFVQCLMAHQHNMAISVTGDEVKFTQCGFSLMWYVPWLMLVRISPVNKLCCVYKHGDSQVHMSSKNYWVGQNGPQLLQVSCIAGSAGVIVAPAAAVHSCTAYATSGATVSLQLLCDTESEITSARNQAKMKLESLQVSGCMAAHHQSIPWYLCSW